MKESNKEHLADMKSNKKTFLYVLTGLSPAVLTETIWCLATQKPAILPTNIVIFTTQTGKTLLEDFLKKHWKNMINALEAKKISIPYEINRSPQEGWYCVFDQKNGIGKKQNLEDIRTQDDNLRIADIMFKRIKEDIIYEEERPTIYASIAGGRKTMGAMLHSVISLIGNENDKIFHVLTDTNKIPPDFAYPGCKMKEKANIKLDFAEVPFVPLYNLLEKNKLASTYNYKSLILELSSSIGKRTCKVNLNAKNCEMLISTPNQSLEIELRYVEFLIASTFFRRAIDGKYQNDNIEQKRYRSFNFITSTPEETEYEKDLRAEYKKLKSKIKKVAEPKSMETEDIRQKKGDLRKKLKNKVGEKLTDLIIPSKKTYSEIPSENITFEDYK